MMEDPEDGINVKLLIVEDESKTAASLVQGFEENGFGVELARDGSEGLAMARRGGFDLIVLDVMLPALSGLEVVQALRGAGDLTPVLFLTARDAVIDRVKGLEAGADDYLVKPFAFSELLARVRTVLRRLAPKTAEPFRLADLELDATLGDACRGGARLGLTRQEFLLLSLFTRRRGEVLSRRFLAEQVWGLNYDSDTNVVEVAVRRLRRKVDDPFSTKLIHTVRNLGYVFDVR